MNAFDVVGVGEDLMKGLSDGTMERIGGMVRDKALKRVEGWLRETPSVSVASSAPALTAGASVLNLAISTMGFAVVMHRIGKIEKQLRETQALLETVDYKIDVGFIANIKAAIDLARSVDSMTDPKTRKAILLQAVNRFLEAERHYLPLADIEISEASRVAADYLSTLTLAYAIAARCYLELEEVQAALTHLREGHSMLRPWYVRHIKDLLTTNPAAYLHPYLKGKTDLARMGRIHQWIYPGTDLNDLFEFQRDGIFAFLGTQSSWMQSLPQAIRMEQKEQQGDRWNKRILKRIADHERVAPLRSASHLHSTLDRLAEVLDTIEAMVEDERRLQGYIHEIELFHERGLSFREWRQLTELPEELPQNDGLVYVRLPVV